MKAPLCSNLRPAWVAISLEQVKDIGLTKRTPPAWHYEFSSILWNKRCILGPGFNKVTERQSSLVF